MTSILTNFVLKTHKSPTLFLDNDLYTGTDADFSGNDPIIYREPLQTDQFDSLSLNGKWALLQPPDWHLITKNILFYPLFLIDNHLSFLFLFQHPISWDHLHSAILFISSSVKQLLSSSTVARYDDNDDERLYCYCYIYFLGDVGWSCWGESVLVDKFVRIIKFWGYELIILYKAKLLA